MSPKTNSIYLFIYDKKKLITITRVTFDYIIVIQVTIIHKKTNLYLFFICGRNFENLYSLCHCHDSDEFNYIFYVKNGPAAWAIGGAKKC